MCVRQSRSLACLYQRWQASAGLIPLPPCLPQEMIKQAPSSPHGSATSPWSSWMDFQPTLGSVRIEGVQTEKRLPHTRDMRTDRPERAECVPCRKLPEDCTANLLEYQTCTRERISRLSLLFSTSQASSWSSARIAPVRAQSISAHIQPLSLLSTQTHHILMPDYLHFVQHSVHRHSKKTDLPPATPAPRPDCARSLSAGGLLIAFAFGVLLVGILVRHIVRLNSEGR